MTIDVAETATVDSLSIRLREEFSSVPVRTIERIVNEVHAGFEGCRIREFIPLLVERESRDRLRLQHSSPSSWGPNLR